MYWVIIAICLIIWITSVVRSVDKGGPVDRVIKIIGNVAFWAAWIIFFFYVLM